LFSILKSKEVILDDLRGILEYLAYELFGKDIEIRWNEDYFPFTDPSLELEIKFKVLVEN